MILNFIVEDINQNPEQRARDLIDQMLRDAGWLVQGKKQSDIRAAQGVAVKEYQTDVGPADYVLFVDAKPVGVIEAKRGEEGQRLSAVEEQSTGYANAKLQFLNNDPLPFVYESTGTITRFTDYRDPKARGRRLFHFQQPAALARLLSTQQSLRARLQQMLPLDPTGLRPAQIKAITNLEESFKNNKPRALIQMATGAGKTFTATTFIYRLLKKPADATRILFLVDTKNLGEQAEQAFMSFQPNDDNRKFTELYNVQRLTSSYIAPDSHVCISTIQRLYSILQGEELDESSELDSPESSSWIRRQMDKKAPAPVVYNPQLPVEFFDFIIIDECHRSIYNLWQQVLEYFDAFLIGLTATPDKRTRGFFKENVVSEYTYEESVLDGVNVPYNVYTIDTAISMHGEVVEAGWYVDRRDKLTRATRWQQEDEDTVYNNKELDRKVVNPSQIRNVIREFKKALQTVIFPDRINADGEYEVPKTLVFAKTDSHADDVIEVIKEEFNEGNDFVKKVTYKASEDPRSVLNRFRNSHQPRIAVTVDMIATGTDVKPLEVLLFMRDVRSVNYFEQMKGRGTRTIEPDSLRLVSSAARYKTHFVLVDAVGANRSKKTESRPLERKPSIPLGDLLGAVNMGHADEDLFLSLANRLIMLDNKLSDKQREKLMTESGGKNLRQISTDLLAAYDPDKVADLAQTIIDRVPIEDRTPLMAEEAREEAQKQLIHQAASNFNGAFNEQVENIRRQLEQIIDHINIDQVVRSEWDKTSTDRAAEVIQEFTDYLESQKDEIRALTIFYDQPYQRRHITYRMLKEVLDQLKLDRPALAPTHVWEAYEALQQTRKPAPAKELTTLVSLIRKVCGIDQELTPYDKQVDENFKNWIFKQNAGKHNRFTPEQMDWLRMIKDHVATSYRLEPDDLDYTPFDSQGGRGKMWQLFGKDMNSLIEELNGELVA